MLNIYRGPNLQRENVKTESNLKYYDLHKITFQIENLFNFRDTHKNVAHDDDNLRGTLYQLGDVQNFIFCLDFFDSQNNE